MALLLTLLLLLLLHTYTQTDRQTVTLCTFRYKLKNLLFDTDTKQHVCGSQRRGAILLDAVRYCSIVELAPLLDEKDFGFMTVIMNDSAYHFFKDLGRKISEVSGDSQKGSFIFQRLLVTIQSFNACGLSTFAFNLFLCF